MDRINSYLGTLTIQYQSLVNQQASLADQQFCLGKIQGIRSALMLLNETNSTVPAHLLA